MKAKDFHLSWSACWFIASISMTLNVRVVAYWIMNEDIWSFLLMIFLFVLAFLSFALGLYRLVHVIIESCQRRRAAITKNSKDSKNADSSEISR